MDPTVLLNPQVSRLFLPVLIVLGFVLLTMLSTIVAAIRGYRKFQQFVEEYSAKAAATVKEALDSHLRDEREWQGKVTERQEAMADRQRDMADDIHDMKQDICEIKRKLGLTER